MINEHVKTILILACHSRTLSYFFKKINKCKIHLSLFWISFDHHVILWILLNYTLKLQSYYNSFGSQKFYFLLSSITEQSLSMSHWETIREKDKERPAVNISKKIYYLLSRRNLTWSLTFWFWTLHCCVVTSEIERESKIENFHFLFFFSIPSVSTVSFVSTSLKS